MNYPESLSVEAAAWMRVQMAIASARAVAPLRDELDKLEAFSCGILGVFMNLMPLLLQDNPAMAAQLKPYWHGAALRTQQLEAGTRQPEFGESIELLEARATLYDTLNQQNLWPTESEIDHQRAWAATKRLTH